MGKRWSWIVGSAAGVLLLTGCQHIPYYDESLNWFSWSEYDPEVRAIESQIPPPGTLAPQGAAPGSPSSPPASGGQGVAPGSGAPGTSTAPPASSAGATSQARGTGVGAAGSVSVADSSVSSSAPSSDPPVGIRNSVGPSVTWRSPRGTP